MKKIISIPNATRTFEALRSLGYDLYSSISDVVDNSITEQVGSTDIEILFDFTDSNHLSCRICDDGCGMNRDELEEAMRLGTETTYGEHDLGKFGMGMKTASLSHCNVLTVVSKKQDDIVCGFRWDMEHVGITDEWELLELDIHEIEQLLLGNNLSFGTSGTIVMWDDLFNLNHNLNTYTTKKLAENYYFRLESKLKLHLGMIYHRFLEGSVPKQQIQLKVNGERIVPWDPFCLEERHSKEVKLPQTAGNFKIDGFPEEIEIKGYVLPNKDQFSSEVAWKKAKGLLSWNDSQGYYIYRANRIIRFGGWHGTKAKDEHDKLARISIDIHPSLDKLFRITVNKAKVQFPESLFQHLKTKLNPKVIKIAKSTYNKKDLPITVNNKFRKNSTGVGRLASELVTEHKIQTTSKASDSWDQEVEVHNPTGKWNSNEISEFLKYGSAEDFEVISDHLGNDTFWKILCNDTNKFIVVLNADHPFYSNVYHSAKHKRLTGVIDALIFSLAYAELYNRNDANELLFNTYKSVFSKTLEKITREELI